MMLLTTDWHAAWTSYEWWRDIGTALISAAVAVIIGASTIVVAVTSARFARAVKRQDDERNARLDRERYEARLVEVVTPAMVEMIEYINLFSSRWSFGDVHHRRSQAAVTARLTLTDAVSRGSDREVMNVILREYVRVSETPNSVVQVEACGELIGLLAALAARSHSADDLKGTTATVLDRARKGAAL